MRVCALAVVVGLASGCMSPGVPGSGTLKQESREVGDFTVVELGGTLQATVRVGPKAPIVLKGDDNLLPLITTEVRDGRLVVGVEHGVSLRPTQPITFEITTPTLEGVAGTGASELDVDAARGERFAIDVNGAARAGVRELDAEAVALDVSGAAHATLAGKVKALTLRVSGAAHVQAEALAAESVAAEISGASHVDVSATAAVRGNVSGASQFRVAGSPAVKAVDTSGAAHVTYQDAAARR